MIHIFIKKAWTRSYEGVYRSTSSRTFFDNVTIVPMEDIMPVKRPHIKSYNQVFIGLLSLRTPEGTLTGINPGKSHGQGPWVSHRKHRLDDKLVGKQDDTFLLDILMMEARLQWMPRLERSRLGLQMMYWMSFTSPLLAFIY